MIKNTKQSYGILTKLFHWMIGPSIIYLLYLGFTMSGLENSPEKWSQYATHKSIGMLILFASLLFYIWRSFSE